MQNTESKYIMVAGSEESEVEIEMASDKQSVKNRLSEILSIPRGYVPPEHLEALDRWDGVETAWFHGDNGYSIGVFPVEGPAPEMADA